MGKEYEEWSGEILSCSLRVFELPVRAIKFLKWLIYDFSALKISTAKPLAWKLLIAEYAMSKSPFDMSHFSQI